MDVKPQRPHCIDGVYTLQRQRNLITVSNAGAWFAIILMEAWFACFADQIFTAVMLPGQLRQREW